MKKYRTSDLAQIAGIHPNTVRKYEEIGFISSVPRAANGYREYGERHLYQIKICRCIFDYGWLGKELRTVSLAIIDAMVNWDLNRAYDHGQSYIRLIEREYKVAQQTSGILKRWIEKDERVETDQTFSRREAAKLIGVTPETLRTWERNGLIKVPRMGTNRTRIYSEKEIERLRVIYMLRQSRFSISSILQSLNQYDSGNNEGVIEALNNPKFQEDTSWVFVGDRWMEALKEGEKGAIEILEYINEAKNKKI